MPGQLDSVVLKIAELCNLNCGYCYLYNHEDRSYQARPKMMGEVVFEATLRAIREYCDHRPGHEMTIIFHGGEPLLVGKERLHHLAERARHVLGRRLYGITLQTNATLVDKEWAEILSEQQIRIGVSLDGPPRIHDAWRVDHLGRGSHRKTLRGLKLMQDADLDPAVLCVIDPGQNGLRVYRYFRRIGVQTMNFLLPDVSHDNKDLFYGGRGPTPVADYLIPIFDNWYEEDDPNIRIRLFWGLIRMLMGGVGETDAFGNPPMSYVVVETDGSIEPLDALRVCRDGVTVNSLNVLRHGLDDLHLGQPLLAKAVEGTIPLCNECLGCPEKQICGGGYLPQRYSAKREFDNPSVWCKDILKLLHHIRKHLPEEIIAVHPDIEATAL